jgi:PAS domain S-box-containing protein
VLAHRFSRQGKTTAAAITLIATIILMLIYNVAFSEDSVFLLYYLVMPLLLGGTLLSMYLNRWLITLLVGIVILLPLVVDHIRYEHLPVLFLITFSLLLRTVNLHQAETERLRQESLAISERRYRTLFQAISDPVVVHNDHQLIDANDAFFTLVGFSLEDLQAMSVYDMIAPEDHALLQETDENQPIEIRIITHDGRSIAVEAKGRIYDEQRRLRVVTLRDLSARKAAEENRIALQVERERNDLLRRFISDASHDLRTPLTVMFSSLHLLQATKDAERHTHHLSVLTSQVERMRAMIDNLLQITRLERVAAGEMHFQPGDLNALVQDVVETMQSMANVQNVTLTFSPGTLPETCLFDADELRRAVGQIITNAISYTPEGGRVTVRTAATDTEVLIEVEDTGIGIPAEEIERIFEVFYRVDASRNSDQGGMGLGLTIAQTIINAHGGQIDVTSTPGAGSTFSVRLPTTAAAGA